MPRSSTVFGGFLLLVASPPASVWWTNCALTQTFFKLLLFIAIAESFPCVLTALLQMLYQGTTTKNIGQARWEDTMLLFLKKCMKSGGHLLPRKVSHCPAVPLTLYILCSSMRHADRQAYLTKLLSTTPHYTVVAGKVENIVGTCYRHHIRVKFYKPGDSYTNPTWAVQVFNEGKTVGLYQSLVLFLIITLLTVSYDALTPQGLHPLIPSASTFLPTPRFEDRAKELVGQNPNKTRGATLRRLLV